MAEEMSARPSLLDYLSWECGCEFMSDLHYMKEEQLSRVLAKIPEDVFSEREWMDTFSYLTGQKELETKEKKSVKTVLMEKLREGKKEVEK